MYTDEKSYLNIEKNKINNTIPLNWGNSIEKNPRKKKTSKTYLPSCNQELDKFEFINL